MSRCKHCKVKFTPEEAGKRLHDACIEPWTIEFREKQQRKAIAKRNAEKKAEKAKDRATRERQKTIPQLIAEAQKEFNAYIRERDKHQPCICCGAPLDHDSVGGGYDCGHYRSTGSAPHLRFDESNAHAQTKKCNRWGAGRAVDYRIGLIARIGLEAVEALEADNEVVKWDRETLRQIKVIYRAKLRALKKENA